MLFKCPDCDCDIEVYALAEESEIFVCQGCGLELEYKDGNLIQLVLEGDDQWGE